MIPDEFPYTVRDNSGQSMGSRRTMADARALAERLEVTVPAKGPYVIGANLHAPTKVNARR